MTILHSFESKIVDIEDIEDNEDNEIIQTIPEQCYDNTTFINVDNLVIYDYIKELLKNVMYVINFNDFTQSIKTRKLRTTTTRSSIHK